MAFQFPLFPIQNATPIFQSSIDPSLLTVFPYATNGGVLCSASVAAMFTSTKADEIVIATNYIRGSNLIEPPLGFPLRWGLSRGWFLWDTGGEQRPQ